MNPFSVQLASIDRWCWIFSNNFWVIEPDTDLHVFTIMVIKATIYRTSPLRLTILKSLVYRNVPKTVTQPFSITMIFIDILMYSFKWIPSS